MSHSPTRSRNFSILHLFVLAEACKIMASGTLAVVIVNKIWLLERFATSSQRSQRSTGGGGLTEWVHRAFQAEFCSEASCTLVFGRPMIDSS
ncbi:uncharacterized protein BDZ83DRAFT_347927 [Colletotrichum acutatum]|uniref:Secreted protein n=1 Tax=Glomerella acutata TaxID=27357 RepID=A0AAD8UP25_GLOAC|nr:uncharacterized protein BDZ83DRAFT_347927 [Colletotrichum acutatum]KAK1724599.1 hypothetical protein BDZ83DRAFT_347927 [Colletotrichum acutatum]